MTKKTLWVGITGGIGSGKTTVCRLFETLDIAVYYADIRAKALMTENSDLVRAIKNLLGAEAYLENGSLNRAHIAQIVFSDPAKLAKLNALVHPAVHEDSRAWMEARQENTYILYEAALMVESGGYKRMDQLITVFAPQEVRIERVIERDNTTRESVMSRINKQLPEERKLEIADFVIHNDGAQSLIKQVYAIHQQLINIGMT